MAQPAKPPKKKSGSLGLILGVFVFFVFAGGGGAAAAYFFWWAPSQQTADADEAIADARAQAQAATDQAQAQAQAATEQAQGQVAAATTQVGDAIEQGSEQAQGAVEAAGVVQGAEPVAEQGADQEAPIEDPAEEPTPVEEPAQQAEARVAPVEPHEGESARPARARTYEQRARAEVRSAAQQCFGQNSAHGQVTVQISVAHDGRIATSRVVSNGTGDQGVARCISGALVGRRIQGAGPPGGVTLDISFSG